MEAEGGALRSSNDLRRRVERLTWELELLRAAVRRLGADIHGDYLPWSIERAVTLPRPAVGQWSPVVVRHGNDKREGRS